MEKNTDYFQGRSEAERMRNVANQVHDIVNPTQPEPEVQAEGETETPSEPVEPTVNPVVDLVGKAISTHKPRGMFMQGVQSDGNPKI